MKQNTEVVSSESESCPNCDMNTLNRPHGENHVVCVACNKEFGLNA